MAEFIDAEAEQQLRAQLRGLAEPVKLVYFTQPHPCSACRDQQSLLEELERLSEKLALEVHELAVDDADAKRYGVDNVPTTVVRGERDHSICF